MLFVAFLACIATVLASISVDHYQCATCLAIVDQVVADSKVSTYLETCKAIFPTYTGDLCYKLFPAEKVVDVVDKDSRKSCAAAGYCPAQPQPYHSYAPQSSNLDIRVSKAFGSRGYDNVRLSVISNATISSSLFSYSSPFKYRWQKNDVVGNMVLNTGIVSVTPGVKTTYTVNGQNIDILIPKKGDGTRGAILADPCFTSEWIICAYAHRFDTFARTTELLNAMMAHEDMSYFQILGDNFYDQNGNPSASFFNALTLETKSKVFYTVPGNHDFWVNANPKLWVPKDQQGNGFMQFYGQDVKAGEVDIKMPYDFSVNPDGPNKGGENLPPASNYMFYNQVGNTAFIGYSGAHSWASHESFFEEACQWAATEKPDAIVLLNHWNGAGDGCDDDMTSAAVYSKLLTMPQCAPVANKMRHFMGHKHCNLITDKDVGFMVGAMGMADASGCGGDFGFPVVDTTGGKFQVYYFPIDAENGFVDNYDAILSCVKANGASGCYHLATLWSSTPL